MNSVRDIDMNGEPCVDDRRSSVTRTCLTCGQRVVGRADKKFCGDACRSEWHNRAESAMSTVQSINQILRTNRKILADLHNARRRRISIPELQLKGFQLNFFTHRGRTFNGKQQYFCYEYGYRRIGKDVIELTN